MSTAMQEQKRMKLRRFLERLAEDKTLRGMETNRNHSLSEMLTQSGCHLRGNSIDIAELITVLLHKKGKKGCAGQLMEHILGGGTIEEFLKNDSFRMHAEEHRSKL